MFPLISTTLLGALTLTSGTAYAQACGDVLTADTTLTATLSCGGPGFVIGADDIVLDCDGYALNGPGSDIGILLDGRTGVTVKNCIVNRFSVGILLTDASANAVFKNSVSGSTSVGSGAVQLSNGSDGNVLKLNRSYANDGRGIAIIDSTGNLLEDNGVMGNGFRGIDLIDASGNAVLRNYVGDNTSGGVVISGTATGNILHDNDVFLSSSEGFAVLAGEHYFSANRSDDNGTWGINDSSGSSWYLLNQCVGNVSGTSSPAGLCF